VQERQGGCQPCPLCVGVVVITVSVGDHGGFTTVELSDMSDEVLERSLAQLVQGILIHTRVIQIAQLDKQLLISGIFEGRDGAVDIEDVLHDLLVFLEKKTETPEPTLV